MGRGPWVACARRAHGAPGWAPCSSRRGPPCAPCALGRAPPFPFRPLFASLQRPTAGVPAPVRRAPVSRMQNPRWAPRRQNALPPSYLPAGTRWPTRPSRQTRACGLGGRPLPARRGKRGSGEPRTESDAARRVTGRRDSPGHVRYPGQRGSSARSDVVAFCWPDQIYCTLLYVSTRIRHIRPPHDESSRRVELPHRICICIRSGDGHWVLLYEHPCRDGHG